MSDPKETEPRGLGEHVRGLAGEYAHEQGWGLNEAERTHEPETPQDTDGGGNYEYGARDFGDEAVNTGIAGGEPAQAPATLDSGAQRTPQPHPAKNQGDPLDDIL